MKTSINKKYRALALKDYQVVLKSIPAKIRTYDSIPKLQELWASLGFERKSTRDFSFPIYLYLRLGKYDSIPESVHVFIEEAVEQGLLEEDFFNALDSSDGMISNSTSDGLLRILFDPSQSSRCRIIKKEESKTKTETTTETIIIC